MRVRFWSLLNVLAFASVAPQARAADDKRLQCLSDSEAAQRLRNAGKLVLARERFLQCGREECPALVRQDCETSLEGVESALPSVIVVARDPLGRDLRNVRVAVDGAHLTQSLDGRSMPVDPGAHTFRCEAEGYRAVEQSILLREGEKQRIVEVRLAPLPQARASGPPAAAYVLGGVAVACLAVGGYFGVRALSDYQDMKDRCGATQTCTTAEASSVRGHAIAADIAFGVALVTGAVSGWLFLRPPRPTDAALVTF